MATVLEIVQSVTPRMGIDTPTVLFSSTDRTEQELASTLNEVAQRIGRAHDWRALKTRIDYTGDGTTAAFALPDDYGRMPKDGQVWSSRLQQPLVAIDAEENLGHEVRDFETLTGTWHLAGPSMQFNPVLADSERASWLYVSRNVGATAASAPIATFTADTDTFVLDDRLLGLALLAEWRQIKGLDYAEDLAAAEVALSELISEDKGARIVRQASRRRLDGRMSYPWAITP